MLGLLNRSLLGLTFCIHVRSTSPSGTVVMTSMSHAPTWERVVPRDVDCVELFITVITVTVDISKAPQVPQVPPVPHRFWLEADVASPTSPIYEA